MSMCVLNYLSLTALIGSLGFLSSSPSVRTGLWLYLWSSSSCLILILGFHRRLQYFICYFVKHSFLCDEEVGHHLSSGTMYLFAEILCIRGGLSTSFHVLKPTFVFLVLFVAFLSRHIWFHHLRGPGRATFPKLHYKVVT